MTGEESLVLCTYIRAWELVTNIRIVGESGKWKNLHHAEDFLTDKDLMTQERSFGPIQKANRRKS